MARPKGSRLKIDPVDIAKYSRMGATQADLALKLGCSLATIERRLQERKYREAYDSGRGDMLLSLKAKQIQLALAGNVQMLKWLGEQYLGQAHAHKLVDKDGQDRDLNLASVRAYMQNAGPDETE